MGFLSFLKGMKIEDNLPVGITLRTSKTCGAFGTALIVIGMGLLWQIHAGNPLFCCLTLVSLGSLGVAALSTLLGILILTYRKCVIFSRSQRRIEYLESGLCWKHRATYNFDDLIHVEICPIAQCILTSNACMWVIKAYFQRGTKITGVRLYETTSSYQAEEAASTLAALLNRPLFRNTPAPAFRSFTSQAGA